MFDSSMIFSIPAIIIAFTAYGYAQAKAATMLGDPTPRQEGRLTLNPIPHIEPWGLLVMWLLQFGWGRAMPMNVRNFKDPMKGIVIVALAGLAANLIAAFLAMVVLNISLRAGVLSPEMFTVLRAICWFNVMFVVLNLIPIPPLDGSRILAYFLPPRLAYQYESYGQYGFIILIVCIYVLNLGALLRPIINGILAIMQTIIMLIL